MHEKFIVSLITIILSLLTCESVLTVVDPTGILHYYNDATTLYVGYRADSTRQFVLLPDDYQMQRWSATVLADSSRRVPDSKTNAACKWVILGDSLTFGWGVDDKDTWANILAQQTACQVINAGVPAYNIWEILATYHAYPGADLYIYLLIDNDADRDADKMPLATKPSSAILTYLNYMRYLGNSNYTVPQADFWTALTELESDPHMIVVGFNDAQLALNVQKNGSVIHLIAPYTGRISRADWHPDALGHRQISDEIQAAIKNVDQKRKFATVQNIVIQ